MTGMQMAPLGPVTGGKKQRVKAQCRKMVGVQRGHVGVVWHLLLNFHFKKQ